MLFAAETDSLSGWVGVIVQSGAIGILGYHLIVGLPKMLREERDAQAKSRQEQRDADERIRVASDAIQASAYARMVEAFRMEVVADRTSGDKRAELMVNELVSLRRAIPEALAPKIETVVEELKKQSVVIGETNELLGKWPSDPGRICQALEAIRQAEPRLIEALKAAGCKTEAEMVKVIAREIAHSDRERKKKDNPHPQG